jgi:cytochrome c
VIVTDGYNERITITTEHSAGDAPVDNLGDIVTNEDELKQCQIQSGTKKNYSGYIKGFRNIFYGSKNEKIELTSEKIRGLSKKSVSKGSFDINVIEGAS